MKRNLFASGRILIGIGVAMLVTRVMSTFLFGVGPMDPVTYAAERVARFEREARTLASLNHPHIAQIHGFEHRPPPLADDGVGGTRGRRTRSRTLKPKKTAPFDSQ